MDKKLKHNTSDYSRAKKEEARYFRGYGNITSNLNKRK